MSLVSLSNPSRVTLLMWAAGICATIALVLAVGTHRPWARDGKPTQATTQGWVRGLFANNELRRSGR